MACATTSSLLHPASGSSQLLLSGGYTKLMSLSRILDIFVDTGNFDFLVSADPDLYGVAIANKYHAAVFLPRVVHPMHLSLQSYAIFERVMRVCTLRKLQTLEIRSSVVSLPKVAPDFRAVLDEPLTSLRTMRLINLHFCERIDYEEVFIDFLDVLQELRVLDISGIDMQLRRSDLGDGVGKLQKLESFTLCSFGFLGACCGTREDWKMLAAPIARLPRLRKIDITGSVSIEGPDGLAEEMRDAHRERWVWGDPNIGVTWVADMKAIDGLFSQHVEVVHEPWQTIFEQALALVQ